MNKNLKYRNTLIFLAFGLVLLAIMLWFIGIDKVLDALTIANPIYILIAILLQIITYFLYTVRWKFILNVTDKKYSFKDLLPMILVSLSVNNITPSGRGGGEPVRAYLLSNEKKDSFSETFATVIADRALDTFPFILLAIITIIELMTRLKLSPVLLGIMIAAVILIVIAVSLLIYVSVNESFGEKVTNWITKITVKIFKKKDPEEIRASVESAIKGFQSTMQVLTSDKRIIYYALPLSFFIWFVEIFRVYVVFLAFGCRVDPFMIGEVFIVSSLVGMIPLLPGGIGAVDGFMILLYSSSGISSSISAATTVIERLISFWMTTIIGLLILPIYGGDVLDHISLSLSNKDEDSEAEKINESEEHLELEEDSESKEGSESEEHSEPEKEKKE